MALTTNILDSRRLGVTGNGDFDIADIMAKLNPNNTASFTNDVGLDANVFGASISDSSQNANTQDEALINDITDMIDELQSNMSAGAGNELESMMSRIAGRLLQSGLTSAAANAIMLEVERRDGEDGKGFSAEQWERVKEGVEKERKEQAKLADFAEDANNGQLSTKPDQYGLSEQNYADLNNDLKSRDGQDRFMAFLRMMNPGLSDAQIHQKMEDAQIVAAVRSGQANDDQKAAYDSMSPARRDDASNNLAQYQQMNGRSPAPVAANLVNAEMGAISANASSFDPEATTTARSEILNGNDSTLVAPQSRTSVATHTEGKREFAASAPSLRDHHRASLAATTPLDQPAPPVISNATPVAPVATVAATGAGGFDV